MNPSSHNSKPPATDRHHPDDVDDPGAQKTVSQGDGASSDLPETRHFAGKLRVGDRLASRYEILDQLGRGGFGAVYRAQDHELNRQVAVKRVNGLRSFVSGHIRGEARAIASLNHPNIISIYDLISVSSREMLIVMECPDGMTLADHLTKARVPVVEAVDIALQVAVALQHAHSRQLVHSDLKPANLLIATDGRVRLLDFGLAVAYFPDADKGRLTGGTPGYMSPEQIRGESHLIDGRVDIWALGVVLYQLLTGCRPFTGADARATYNSTLRDEPAPIRQLRPEVDYELQRIVFRCLEKRMSDRYESASDLIDDLRAWSSEHSGEVEASQSLSPVDPPEPSPHFRSLGLQPFTEQDADSYLSLVPGSRDRNGMPESIRFWKRWAESDDPDLNSPVGVLYGPSGSGKTSFVRAGLVRQLDPAICCVYVECRAGDLGGRISRIIQSRIQEKSTGSSLRDLLTRIRTGDSTRRGFRKLLIILDQFEAWSQRASMLERREFADALRQCDGGQIRALVVTRDDFWMGVTVLLRRLELPLQEGRNIASVDLIDPPHARRMLESIGRAVGTLPSDPEPLTSQQQQFIRQAVDELAIGESVIAVHLVIFAQIVKLREWTPRALRNSGGVTGACSLYFQELFGSRTTAGFRSPEYRRIAPAVIPILSALLPTDDGSVLDSSKTESELRSEAHLARCAHVFKDCLRVLSEDLRIIAVMDSDSDGQIDEQPPLAEISETDVSGCELRYRLSHDFLAEPIADWIDRIRKRSWRGRKLARLSEISEAWGRRPSHVYMPGFFEYCSLVAASRFGGRNRGEAEFIRAATKHHSGRISVAVIALLAFMGMTGVAFYQRGQVREERARVVASKVDLLLNGPAEDVTAHIDALNAYRGDAVPAVQPWANSIDPQLKIRAQLFLGSRQTGSFDQFAPLIEQAPVELFPPVLEFARSSPEGLSVLREVVGDNASTTKLTNRAAILLNDLGDSEPIETLLQGSDDFDKDSAVWMEAAHWRDKPDRWIELLKRSVDTEVQYHTILILSSFPREELIGRQPAIDIAALVNSPNASIHSAGRLLAAHLGEGPSVPTPPSNADWRLGPDDIPMVRIEAGELSYVVEPNSPDQLIQVKIEKPFWVTTVPVGRRFFNEFLDDTPALPDGSKPKQPWVEPAIPADQKTDLSQPVFGINHPTAVTFCNWLSRREALDPCYRYLEQPTNATPNAAVKEKYLMGAPSQARLPKPPWEADESANGYRLPTPDQYAYIVRCQYRRGVPWRHAKTLAQIGGAYAPPPGQEFPRPLFSLMPNRLGLFVNDTQCGTWVLGRGKGTCMAVEGKHAYLNIRPTRISKDHSIYLVQLENDTTN